MTQIVTGTGLGGHGSSLGQLGGYGPKGVSGLGQGGESVYVNAATGNVWLTQADGFLRDTSGDIDLFQSYNSRAAGGGWRFNLETRLIIDEASSTVMKRIDEDGHESLFTLDSRWQMYLANDGSSARLTLVEGGWQYEEGTGQRRCVYSKEGQLTAISDRDGHLIRVSYQNGQLASLTDNNGEQRITWTFKQGLLAEVSFQSAGETAHHLTYEYDAHQRVSRVSRDLGDGKCYWISYEYAGDSNLISDIRQSDGTLLHLDYDGEGRVIRLVDGEGRVSRYQYMTGQTLITNDLGEAWTYFYDAEARLTGIDGPANYHVRYYYEGKRLARVVEGTQRWEFFYNEAGDCTRVESPSGDWLCRSYDVEHRVLTETRYQIFNGEHYPSQALTKRFVYDEKGHLRFEVSADGTVTEYRYNSDGLCTTSRTYLSGRLNVETDVSLAEMTSWCALQAQQAVSLISYRYDWRGGLTEEIHYTQVNEQGEGVQTNDALVSYSRFDAAGRLVEKAFTTASGLSHCYYFYDDLGRLLRTLDNQQHEQRVEYDDTHQRVIKTAANGLQTIETYDHSGLLLWSQCLDAAHDYGRITYRYDAASRLIAETDVEGKSAYFFYDAQGRLEAQVASNGLATDYLYDDDGHCVLTHQYQTRLTLQYSDTSLPDWATIKPTTMKDDCISQVVYNNYGQIAWQIDAEGAVIGYQYDAQNRVIAKTAYANRLSNFLPTKRLSFDEIVLVASKNDRQINYYYDKAGRLQGEINGEGGTVSYRYDSLGHLVERCQYANKADVNRTGDWQVDAPASAKNKDIHHYSLYNAAGLKIVDIDAEGYLTEYHYDACGLLTDTICYYTKLDYGFIPSDATTLDAIRPKAHTNDHRTQYRYNDLNQLIEEKAYNGLVINYTYNESGLVISKTTTDYKTHEARGQRYRYDAQGRVIQSLDALGVACLERGDTDVEAVWQQHGLRYTYDIAGRLLSKTNALNQSSRYFYNDSGLLTYTLSAAGAVTETRYNVFQQVETTIRYSACWVGGALPTCEQLQQYLQYAQDARFDDVTHYEYNSLGLLTCKRQGSGGAFTTHYNAFGELEQTIASRGINREMITSYDYDRRGLERVRIEDDGGINKTSTSDYDAFGWLIKTVDSRQGVSTYWLSKRGEQILIDNPLHGRKVMLYDAFGRLLSVEDKTQRDYSYDDQTNTLTLERADSIVVTQFNAFGDQIMITDGNQNTTRYQYDARGQLTQVDGPELSTTRYQYDAEGRLLFQEDRGGKVTQYTYDAENRVLSKTIDPQGLNRISTYTYDGLSRQLQVIDNGQCTQFTYDARGNLIKKCLDPKGLNLITEFTYTEDGLLARQTSANKATAYEWDPLGQCLSMTIDPDGLQLCTRYEYDNNGNLIAETDANQQRTQYVYDANNQLRYRIDARGVVTEHCYGIKGSEKQTITYANRIASGNRYFDESSLIAALQPDSNNDHYQFFDYDTQNRLVLFYDGLGYVTQYTYDANDNLIAKEINAIPCALSELKKGARPVPAFSKDSRTTCFAYDGLNQLRFQISPDWQLSEYEYDSAGQVIKETRFAHPLSLKENQLDYSLTHIQASKQVDTEKDQSSRYQYDLAGRLLAKVSSSGIACAYQYDEMGNLSATTQYATPLSTESLKSEHWASCLHASANDRLTRFVYDNGGREIYRISATGHVVERRYDAAGNVLAEIAHAQVVSPSLYNQKSITEALGLDKSLDHLTAYKYDAAGRLLKKTDALGNPTSYTYDKNNNVLSKLDAKSACWSYRYDEANQLIETISPVMTVSTWRSTTLVEESRAIITRNRYDSFGNLITVIRDADGINQCVHYTYDANHRKLASIYPDRMVNSVGEAANNSRSESMQTLTETNRYNAFGELIASCDRAGNTRYFVYDQDGRMAYAIDANRGVCEYKYDAFDNVTKKTSFSTPLAANYGDYSAAAIRKAVTVSEQDRHEQYSYDNENRLIESRKDVLLSYNARAGKYQQLSPTIRFNYNAFGETILSAVKLSEDDWAISRSYYNTEGQKTASVDAEGYLTSYTYNEFGLLSNEVQYAVATTASEQGYLAPASNPKDRSLYFYYDALGQLSSKTLRKVSYQRLTGAGSRYETVVGDLTSSYRYDALGNLVMTTDAAGNTAYSYYNESGQLSAKVGAETKAGRPATSYRYDALGQLVESRQWAGGAMEVNEHSFTLRGASSTDIIQQDRYDKEGHLIAQTNGLGHVVNYSFDANGNIARRWQVLTQIDDSRVVQDKRYRYDAENHLLQSATIKADGTQATEDAVYNAFGEVAAKGVDGVLSTRFDYDKAGRLWRSNASGYFQIFVYDLSENITQLVTSTNAYGSEYDNNGVDLSERYYETVIDFNQQASHYDLQRQDNLYDRLGRLLSKTKDGSARGPNKQDPIEVPRAIQTQQLDRWGNVISHTNANGYTTYYEYNAFNDISEQRLPEMKVVDEQGVARLLSPVLYFAYDVLGRAIAMTDANGHTVSKILDAEGHVIGEIDAKGNQRNKEYDLFGQLKSSSDERGYVTSYLYDSANRLVAVTSPQALQRYQYNADGQLIQQTDGVGNTTKYWYDALGHQVKRESKEGIVSTYTYDDAGHKTGEEDANGNRQSWTYDANGRLIMHSDLGGHETRYTYNVNGLLLTEQSNSGKDMTYRYYSDGQLLEYADKTYHETVSYTYDAEGNVQSKDSGKIGSWILEKDHYEYDALGRLVQVRRRHPDDQIEGMPKQDKSLLSIDYEYDAAGNIRDTKVMTNYPGSQRSERQDYFLYDENNRMVVNKGQLQNGRITMTASQGSELSFDAVGNLASASRYENGKQTTYNYRYNGVNLLEGIRKDGIDLQTKVYDAAGNITHDFLYDKLGLMSQHNEMLYHRGQLRGTINADWANHVVSRTGYQYDRAGNLTDFMTDTPRRDDQLGSSQRHHYRYELWDSYQQSIDDATLSIEGRATQYGQSRHLYNINGQLNEVIDAQIGSNGKNNSTRYFTSSLDGVRARCDQDGQTSYLTVAGKTIGDFRVDSSGATHLDVYGGFTPTGTGEVGFGTMMELWQRQNDPWSRVPKFLNYFNETQMTDGTLPNAPQDNLGDYTLKAGDTLESIALQVYGDSSLWYLLADANGVTDRNAHAGEKGSQLHAGQRLIIPPVAGGQHHSNQTHKVIGSSDWLGNTSATTPLPPAPPQIKHHQSPWRIVSTVIVAVVSVVATVMSAGALGLLAGGLTSSGGIGGLMNAGLALLGGGSSLGAIAIAGIAFTAGFVGSLAAQGVAAAFNLQQGIDFKGALITGLATAATAGVGRLLNGNANYNNLLNAMDKASNDAFSIKSAATMMERDALSQSINLATRKHQHFDWLELGASATTAGVMGSQQGQNFANALQSKFGKASTLVSNQLQALSTNALSTATNGNHFDASQVLLDNLGNAIGNTLTELPGSNELTQAAETAANEAQQNEEVWLEATTLNAFNDAAVSKAAIAAEQARGAWNSEGDDLIYNSPLFKSWSGAEESPGFESGVLWGSKIYGVEQFVSGSGASIDIRRPLLTENTSQLHEAVENNFNLTDAKTGLKKVYDEYGAEMAKIVEKMYRFETGHFESAQYHLTGTAGMEALKGSKAPYYGWASAFFKANPEYAPIGTTGLHDGKGISGQGGNKQKKGVVQYVKFSSVDAGMLHLAYRIKNVYHGDYARWHSSNDRVAQQKYREELKYIRWSITKHLMKGAK